MCDCNKSSFQRRFGAVRQGQQQVQQQWQQQQQQRMQQQRQQAPTPQATESDIDLCLETTEGRKINTRCLLWTMKDVCCSRVRPVPQNFPLVSTFSALLAELSPLVDEQNFDEPFVDGEPMPSVRTPTGADVNWLAMAPIDGSDAKVWLEQGADSDVKVLRVRLPPGVLRATVRAILAAPDEGLVRSADLTVQTPFEYQSYDGRNNNVDQPDWGAANTALLRIGAPTYADGRSQPTASSTPRAVSNALCRWTNASGEQQPPLSAAKTSDWLWQFLQFVDHELDLTPNDPTEPLNIVAPADDPTLPGGTIHMSRSRFVVDEQGVRQQINVISAFVDGSNVYGSSKERALALRLLDGSGKLKTSHGGRYPPYNVGSVQENDNPTASVADHEMFMCGDVRANENPGLLANHLIFVLRHNQHCEQLLRDNPQWKGDEERLFQQARRLVIAEMQHIIYDEALPLLLGSGRYALPAYTGYSSSVHPGIANEFSAALYRLGHTMVSDKLKVGNRQVPLADMFFDPTFVTKEGIRAIVEGSTSQTMQRIDTFVVEALRNMLFGRPDEPSGALHDLASINMNRADDHGLPKYNAARVAYGLAKKNSFAELSSDESIQQALASVYGTVDDIHLWIGALAEDHVGDGAQVGELTATGLREQFTRLRDGDRFWYESILSASQIAAVKATTFSDIIRQTTGAQVQDNCFVVTQ